MQLLDRTTSRLYGSLLLVLFALTAAFAIPRTTAQQDAYDASRTVADQLYRAKRFDDAASTLQNAVASGAFDREIASELVVIAAFYDELGRAYAIATDPATPLQQGFAALRLAGELDDLLGGA